MEACLIAGPLSDHDFPCSRLAADDVSMQRNQARKRQQRTTQIPVRSHLRLLYISAEEPYFSKRPCTLVVRSAPEHVGQLVEVRGEQRSTLILEVKMMYYRESYSQSISD